MKINHKFGSFTPHLCNLDIGPVKVLELTFTSKNDLNMNYVNWSWNKCMWDRTTLTLKVK